MTIPTLTELSKNATGRAKLLVLIERHVKKTLTPAEYAIYTYIADRTLRFNKSWECITAKDVVEGKRDGEGRWIHCGVKMTERNVYRILSTLTEKGYILKKPWRTYGNFYQYAINLESEIFNGYENSITMMYASTPVVEDPELDVDDILPSWEDDMHARA